MHICALNHKIIQTGGMMRNLYVTPSAIVYGPYYIRDLCEHGAPYHGFVSACSVIEDGSFSIKKLVCNLYVSWNRRLLSERRIWMHGVTFWAWNPVVVVRGTEPDASKDDGPWHPRFLRCLAFKKGKPIPVRQRVEPLHQRWVLVNLDQCFDSTRGLPRD